MKKDFNFKSSDAVNGIHAVKWERKDKRLAQGYFVNYSWNDWAHYVLWEFWKIFKRAW